MEDASVPRVRAFAAELEQRVAFDIGEPGCEAVGVGSVSQRSIISSRSSVISASVSPCARV